MPPEANVLALSIDHDRWTPPVAGPTGDAGTRQNCLVEARRSLKRQISDRVYRQLRTDLGSKWAREDNQGTTLTSSAAGNPWHPALPNESARWKHHPIEQ
jgi:hypothetical protein